MFKILILFGLLSGFKLYKLYFKFYLYQKSYFICFEVMEMLYVNFSLVSIFPVMLVFIYSIYIDHPAPLMFHHGLMRKLDYFTFWRIEINMYDLSRTKRYTF